MNKEIKEYIKCLKEILSTKYNIPKNKATVMVQFSYVIPLLKNYPEDIWHDDMETVAENIYMDWME